ncbi:MAG: protealysin inhibitor emfourin [Actinomadura sp.]
MKVTVVRTGGFAGIERRAEGDTTTDPVLRDLVEHVDLDAAPPPGQTPDRFTYQIEINGRTATVDETHLTGPLHDLVHHVLG